MNKITEWIKNHKTHILVTSGIIVTGIGVFLLVDNSANIKNLYCKSPKVKPKNQIPLDCLSETPSISYPDIVIEIDEVPVKIINVPRYVRNLPDGYHPSEKKIAEAAMLNIDLGDAKTLISDYSYPVFGVA